MSGTINNSTQRAVRVAATLLLLLAAGQPVAGQASEDQAAEGVRPVVPPEKASPGGAAATRGRAVPGGQSNPGGTLPNRRGPGAGAPGAAMGGPGQPGQNVGVRPQNQAGGQGNGGRGAGGNPDGPQPGEDEIVLSAFSDAWDLKSMVEYVAETLGINIIGNDALSGSVVLNGPMVVKRDQLLPLLNSMLETQGFYITSDLPGFYKVMARENVAFNTRGDLATTRIIPTPTIKPSTLQAAINDQLGTQTTPSRISYVDDLGVIIVTDTVGRIDSLTQLVERVLERSRGQKFIRFDLEHSAAAIARQRVLDLLGAPTTPTFPFPIPNQNRNNEQVAAATANIANLADRLSVDPAGNALIFRGYPEEAERIADALQVVDRPNGLRYEQYYAGKGALQIAELAQRLGLGNVEIVDTAGDGVAQTNQPQQAGGGGRGNQILQALQQQQQQQQQAMAGGPVMIVDTARSLIIYYGTDSQQEQLRSLISKFDTEQEQITIATIPIRNQPAIDIADVLNGIVYGDSGSATGNAFLPGGSFLQGLQRFGGTQTGTGRNTGAARAGSRRSTGTSGVGAARQGGSTGFNFRPMSFEVEAAQQPTPAPAQAPARADGQTELSGDDVFIVADPGNNQIVIRGPRAQVAELERLISRLDQRRPQVYIDVQIVSVTATDDFRLAVETQGLIGQFGLNTNFGLSQLGQGGENPASTEDFKSRKDIVTNLSGLTTALIRSESVPLLLTAMKRNADTRILSSPQLLVDDNVEAEIISVDQQPTTTTTVSTGNPTLTSFGGYEEAGTTLYVTPSISDGGYLRLSYEIELSNFIGTGSGGVPPPKQVRNIRSDSVTIPSDTTIIVGGIKVDAKSSTVIKVPILGDIPVLGHLFRDTNKNNSSTRLYVFITPRIARDPTFRDLVLLTRGPQAEAGLAADLPPLEPVMIEMLDPTPAAPLPGAPELPPEPQPAISLPAHTAARAPLVHG